MPVGPVDFHVVLNKGRGFGTWFESGSLGRALGRERAAPQSAGVSWAVLWRLPCCADKRPDPCEDPKSRTTSQFWNHAPQGAQYGLIKEYGLNPIMDPYII